jgi:hypothetical protein
VMPQKQRIPIINEIIHLFRERKEIWMKIDLFFNPSQQPVEPVRKHARKQDDNADLKLQIKRLTDLISKNKKDVRRAVDVAEWERKRDYLRIQYNASKRK